MTYVGNESTTPIKRDTAGSPSPELVEELLKAPYAKVVEHMNSEDRFTRFVARVEAERRPMEELKKALKGSTKPWQVINGGIALARQGETSDRATILGWFAKLKWSDLNKAQKLGLLRAYGLTFSRLGAPVRRNGRP